MIIPIGSTEPITLGPFLTTAGAAVSGQTPAVTLYLNGGGGYSPGAGSSIGATDSKGVASYTPAAADFSAAGELLIVATASGAMEWFRWHQIGPADANTVQIAGEPQDALNLTGVITATVPNLVVSGDAQIQGAPIADVYTPVGTLNGYPYWCGYDVNMYLYYADDQWNLSGTPGLTGSVALFSNNFPTPNAAYNTWGGQVETTGNITSVQVQTDAGKAMVEQFPPLLSGTIGDSPWPTGTVMSFGQPLTVGQWITITTAFEGTSIPLDVSVQITAVNGLVCTVSSAVPNIGPGLAWIAGQTATAAEVAAIAAQNASAVWTNTTRTLTGSGGAIGPTAGISTADIPFRCHPGQTRPLAAQVYDGSGSYATVEETANIAYTVVDCDTGEPVPGMIGITLTPASVLYDMMQTSGDWGNYNFRFTPLPFPEAGTYLIVVTFTGTSGTTWWANFRGRVEW